MDSNSNGQNFIESVGIEESEYGINRSVKRQKTFKKARNEKTKDRISSLPNEILGHILSFLPTKYAVGTCILSTRWKYLWTSLPDLDFDYWLFFHRERPISTREETLKRLRFKNFVNRVLILRNVTYIQRFRLSCCSEEYQSSVINTWICAALRGNVQELDLNIIEFGLEVLPCGFFTCGTLVSLKLNAWYELDVPAFVDLPRLKTLHLKSITFCGDDSARRLFSSCPVLEELRIEECNYENINVFSISALALKRLTIYHGCNLGDVEYKFIIDAPRLEYLNLSVRVGEGSSVKNVESLIEASVEFLLCEDENNYSVFEVFRAISNVKVLHLYGYTMEAFLSSHQELPVFPNVTHMELQFNEDTGWQLLPDLLQNSPKLEVISFLWGLGRKFQWSLPAQVPHCLMHCLKTIEFREFQGLEGELKLVQYFLKNANVLHKLNIDARTCSGHMTKEEELKVSKKLLMFPRRSKTCEVVLS